MLKLSSFFLVLTVILTFATGLVPVNDYDFFWHLKTGEWIWQNKTLPDKDPFSFTSLPYEKADPYRPQTILKSYWLSQLFFYSLYSLSGFKGIVISRAIVFCIILFVLWRTMAKDGIDYRLRIIFLIPYIFIIREYQKERPQLFSFLFAPIVLYLLENLKEACSVQRLAGSKIHTTRYTLYAILPLIMLLWANMHGGFLVGVAFIVAYLVGEWLTYLLPARYIPDATRCDNAPLRFTLVSAISIACVFLNPNTYHTITSFLIYYQSILVEVTLEFLSPLKVYSTLSPNWHSYWALLLFTFLVLVVRFRKFNIPELFILVGTAIASLSAMRYAFFFFVAAIPIIARHTKSFIVRLSQPMSSSVKSYMKNTVNFSLPVALFVLIYMSPLKNMPLKEDIYQDMFPSEAVSFLERNNLPGPMFNDATWGGYLIWRLYPEYKVFIDPRTLNVEVFGQYNDIIEASKATAYAGLPVWKGLLKVYGINIILTPVADRYSGEILPLIIELMKDDEWALVYLDNKASLFLRRTQEAEDFIRAHYFDKKAVWYEISRGKSG